MEIVKRTYRLSNYADMNVETFQMATDFSNSEHFTVIDSYSHIKGRYKGDPIADGFWTSSSDLDEMNEWFVVECQTQHPKLTEMGFTSLPKWQAKYQFAGGIIYGPYYPFYDVSDPTGVKYPKNHGASSIACCRMGPYGGWDLADSLPDFNPISPPSSGDVSTQNHRTPTTTGASIVVAEIFANGVFYRLKFRKEASYNQIALVAEIVGDVIPLKADFMPNPRALFRPGTAPGNIYNYTPPGSGMGFIAENNDQTNGTSDYATTDSSGGGIAFWDENESLVESGFTQPTQYSSWWGMISRFPSSPPAELMPFIPIPWKSGYRFPYFSFPYVRKGAMPGFKLINDKEWLAVGNGYGPFFKWDGVSPHPMEL